MLQKYEDPHHKVEQGQLYLLLISKARMLDPRGEHDPAHLGQRSRLMPWVSFLGVLAHVPR